MKLSVNGVTLYYERSGEGRPVILLHGNGETHEIFDRLIPRLSETHSVYAVDSRGHGQSTLPKPVGKSKYQFHYGDMAEDIAGMIGQLGLQKPVLYGFSDGGIIGLLLASRYPNMLSKLIVSGANLTPRGLIWQWRLMSGLGYFFTRQPLLRLMVKEPNITDKQLHRITVPAVVLAGEKDMVRRAETCHMAEHIPHSVLRILPGETHGSYIVHSDKLYQILTPYLSD